MWANLPQHTPARPVRLRRKLSAPSSFPLDWPATQLTGVWAPGAQLSSASWRAPVDDPQNASLANIYQQSHARRTQVPAVRAPIWQHWRRAGEVRNWEQAIQQQAAQRRAEMDAAAAARRAPNEQRRAALRAQAMGLPPTELLSATPPPTAGVPPTPARPLSARMGPGQSSWRGLSDIARKFFFVR